MNTSKVIKPLASWSDETIKEYFVSRLIWSIPVGLFTFYLGWKLGKVGCQISNYINKAIR